MRMPKLRAVVSWAAISLLLAVSLASAEPYMGLYAGAAFPLKNDIEFSEFRRLVGTPGLADVRIRDARLDTSGVLGGKFGYFLEPLPFLGFELDVFNICGPDFDADRTRTLDTTIGGVPTNVIAPPSSFINTGSEVELRVTNVMLNVIGRVPLMRSDDFPQGRFTPYVGGGGGWVNAQLD